MVSDLRKSLSGWGPSTAAVVGPSASGMDGPPNKVPRVVTRKPLPTDAESARSAGPRSDPFSPLPYIASAGAWRPFGATNAEGGETAARHRSATLNMKGTVTGNVALQTPLHPGRRAILDDRIEGRTGEKVTDELVPLSRDRRSSPSRRDADPCRPRCRNAMASVSPSAGRVADERAGGWRDWSYDQPVPMICRNTMLTFTGRGSENGKATGGASTVTGCNQGGVPGRHLRLRNQSGRPDRPPGRTVMTRGGDAVSRAGAQSILHDVRRCFHPDVGKVPERWTAVPGWCRRDASAVHRRMQAREVRQEQGTSDHGGKTPSEERGPARRRDRDLRLLCSGEWSTLGKVPRLNASLEQDIPAGDSWTIWTTRPDARASPCVTGVVSCSRSAVAGGFLAGRRGAHSAWGVVKEIGRASMRVTSLAPSAPSVPRQLHRDRLPGRSGPSVIFLTGHGGGNPSPRARPAARSGVTFAPSAGTPTELTMDRPLRRGVDPARQRHAAGTSVGGPAELRRRPACPCSSGRKLSHNMPEGRSPHIIGPENDPKTIS
jgi:hypothetical protein